MRALGRNSFWLLLARITAQALVILFVAIIARRLTLESFGQFTFMGAIVLIGNTFTNFGTDTYLIRELARTRNMVPLVSNAFALQLCLSGLWWLVTLAVRPDTALLIYSLSLFPLALFSVSTATLRGFERMDIVWSLSFANGLLQVAAAWIAHDLRTLSVALLAANLLIAGLSCWICYASLPDFKLFPFHAVLPLLKATLPIATLIVLIVLSQRLGVLVVSWVLGHTSTGLFASVARVVEGLKLGHYAVLGALLPMISRRTAESKQIFRKSFWLLLGLSMVMAAAIALLAETVLGVLFGTQYVTGSPLLSMLAWSLMPYTISSFVTYELIAHGQENTLLKVTATSLILFLALYIWLIPAFGLSGAIYAALLGEVIQAALLIWVRISLIQSQRLVPEVDHP